MFRTIPIKGRAVSRALLFLLTGLCFLAGCGLLGAADDQAKGDQDLPLSGVGPYAKQFLDCSGEFPDPIFMTSGDPDVYWGEPWLLQESDSRFMLFFEERDETGSQQQLAIYMQRIEILPAPAGSCRDWDLTFMTRQGNRVPAADPILVLQGGGAPCVFKEGGAFRVWYDLPDESGIDTVIVQESADGSFVTAGQPEPVLRPTESWEMGYVGSPSLLQNPMNGKLQLWYEGSIFSNRSIGYAEYDSAAKRWVKRDSAGRNSVDDPGEVQPALRPNQLDWEYHYPAERGSGTVGMPNVILYKSPVRTFYYMFYTGNLTAWPTGNPLAEELAPLAKCIKEKAAVGAEECLTEEDAALLALLDDQDTSIGLAGSLDGMNWLKASTIQIWGEVAWQVNPIVNEVFAIDALNKLWVMFKGEAYQELIQGSTNVFFPLVIVDEMASCTLNLQTRFFMVFQQSGGLGGTKGLALATVQR